MNHWIHAVMTALMLALPAWAGASDCSSLSVDMEIRYLAIYGLGSDGRWRLRSWQSLRLPQASG